MKSPLERRSFSRAQCLELFESRDANGSELSIREGSPAGAAAGGAGGSSLATSAPNRGHAGSLPPAPNAKQRNPKLEKDKGKEEQVKAESSRRKKLPASQATTGPKAALPQEKRADTQPETGLKARGSLARHMREAVQVFHALGKKQDVSHRSPHGIPETRERLAAPAGASQRAPKALRLPPLPRPLREARQAKGLGASKASAVRVDTGIPGQGKLCPDKAPADSGAEAEEEGAGPGIKRKKDPPEPRREDRRKLSSSDSSHRLESGKNHKTSGPSKIQDRQSPAEISERREAPEEALARILDAVRLPPLLSPLREVEKPKGLGACKASAVRGDTGIPGQGKLCPDKAPADSGAEAEEEGAGPGIKRKKDPPEPSREDLRKLSSSRRLEPGKKNHKLSGPSKIQDPQPTPEISERREAPEEALARILDAVRLPPLLSPLREVEKPKGLGACKASAVRGDTGIPGQGKLCPDKAPADSGAEAEEEGAGPRIKRKKDPPEPSQEDLRKLSSSDSSHRLEPGKKNHKLSGPSEIQDRQSPAEISERREAPEEALARILDAVRLPPLLSPLREVEKPKGLGACKASAVRGDTGIPGQGKVCPDKAPADSGAEAEEEGAGPGIKRKKDPPEPSQEDLRKLSSSDSSHRLEPGKKNHKLSGPSEIQDHQSPAEISERREAPEEALARILDAVRLPPLLSPLREVEKPKGLGACKASAVRGDTGMPGQGKVCPDKAPADSGAEAEEEGAGPGIKRKKDPPEPSQEDLRKLSSSDSSHRLEPGKKNHKLSGPSEIQDRQSPAEISERREAPEEALARILDAVRLPPLLSPLREVEKPKGLGASKASAVRVDTGFPGQGKLCPDKAPADSGAEAEEEGAGPGIKRKKDPPEPSREDGRKLSSSDSSHRLEPGKKNHKLSGPSKIPGRQSPAEISERWEAPEEALARILDAVRLPPLLSPLREAEQGKGLGASKASAVRVDTGFPGQGKLCPDKAPADSGAEAKEEGAGPGIKRKKDPPEPSQEDLRKLSSSDSSHRLEPGKKNHKLSGPSKIQDRQSPAEISERWEAPEEALARILDAVRLPPFLSPLREVEKPKGLGASKASAVRVDTGFPGQGKLCPDKAPADSGAEAEEEGAGPGIKRKKDPPEPSQEDLRKLSSSDSSHRLEPGKKNHKLSGPSKIQDRRSPAEISERREAPEEALARILDAVRLPPLLSPLREVEKPKGLGACKASAVRGDTGIPGQGKVCPDKAPADSGAEAEEEEETVPRKKRKKDPPEPSREDRRKLSSSRSSHRLESGKKNNKLSVPSKIQDRQSPAEISERWEEPEEALARILNAVRLPPLLSPLREVEKPKGLGAPKDSTDQMAKGPQPPRKRSPDTKPPGRSSKPGPKAALSGSAGQKHNSPEAWITDVDTLRRRMLEAGPELRALGKPDHKRIGPVRAPQPPAQAHVRLQAPAAVSETALEASRLPPRHFPSLGLDHPEDIGNTRARGEQAARGLRGSPKPWRGRGLSESGAEPQEEAAPLSNKRKRSHPEPTPEVRNKLPAFLSATKNEERMAGWVGVPWPTPRMQEGGCGTPAEGPGGTWTQAGLWAADRDRTGKVDHSPARPISPGPAGWRAGAFRPPAPLEEWRAERECLKRKAQQERELEAQYTALGQRNFFKERQQEMEIAKYYGYAV